MLTCPVCHRPGNDLTVECPTCRVAMIPATPQYAAAPTYAPLAGPSYGAPAGPPAGPSYQTHGAPPYAAPFPTPGAPVPGPFDPIAPAWDRAAQPGLRTATDPQTSPVVVVVAVATPAYQPIIIEIFN